MHANTPFNKFNKSSVKENLHKLHSRKDLLKNKYKCRPSQNILLNILNTIKHINTLETKLEINKNN